ncbi:MAG: arginase family protein [Bacteroidales bacterium]|nr:arginase family protein [Bacteroidales bacterium]
MFQIIEVSSSLGAPDINCGMEKGPVVLSSVLKKVGEGISNNVIRIEIPVPKPEHSQGEYANSKNLPEILQLNRVIQEEVQTTVKSGNIPLVLMGDDSSTIGTVYGVLANNHDVGIIWFDTHADINTPETSPSGCFYGMGLAHILGFGHPEILELNKMREFIKPSNVIMLGQRNLDEGEKKLIDKQKIILYSGDNLKENVDQKISELSKKLIQNRIKSIFIHYDLDVIDSSEDPPVYAPHSNGLLKQEISDITLQLLEDFEIAGISIANYIPSKDNDNCVDWINNLIMEIVSYTNLTK